MSGDFDDERQPISKLMDQRKPKEYPPIRDTGWYVKWVLIPLIVAAIGALGLIIASGNGQVVINIVNTVLGRDDEKVVRTQVAIELTETKIAATSATGINATATASIIDTTPTIAPTMALIPTAIVTPILPIPTGKLLFSDNFDDGFAHGFSFYSGEWKVVDDGTGNKVLEADYNTSSSFEPSSFSDGVIQFRFRVMHADYKAQHHVVEFSFRDQAITNEPNAYILAFEPESRNLRISYSWTPLQGTTGVGTIETLSGDWIILRLEAVGKMINVFINGNHYLTATDTRITQGGLYLGNLGNVDAQFDDFNVWDVGSK